MPRAEHCEGCRGKRGERVPPPLFVLRVVALRVLCPLVRRSLLSLGPGAEGRSHYLGGGSPFRLPPRPGLRAADEERTRVSKGAQRI
eukprot:scaffold9487_cov105-Isochrysis_galbana.AAC.9